MKTSGRIIYEARGYDYKTFWNNEDYLAELTCNASIEIDNHTLGINNDFTSTMEFSEYLRENNYIINQIPLFRSLVSNSEKITKKYHTSQFALDLRLLSLELSDVENLSKNRLESLMRFLLDASKEFKRASYPILSYS